MMDRLIKRIRLGLVLLILPMILSSCMGAQQPVVNQDPVPTTQEEPEAINDTKSQTPINNTESQTPTPPPVDQELVKSMDDLYRAYHSLSIQKSGDNTVYSVINPLEYCFADMLSKVEAVDVNSVEGKKFSEEFDYQYYDYKLKFDGAADILFTLKGNTFHFEGEDQLYILWGDSKPIWNSLNFDKQSASVDIPEESVKVMVRTYNEDVDGDGKGDTVELYDEKGKNEGSKGDLILKVNDSSKTVMADEEWYTKPFHTIGEMPQLSFIQDKNGKSKAILFIYSWATNGIGSTGVISGYGYTDGQFTDLEITEPEKTYEYDGGNMLYVSFPAFDKSIGIEVDKDSFPEFAGDNPMEFLEGEEAFFAHPFDYSVNDYNGDDRAELCGHSILFLSVFSIYLGGTYTYYQFENGELKPVQAVIASSHSEDDKIKGLADIIFDRIQYYGYLSINDQGLPVLDYVPNYEYTPEEFADTLKKLQNEGLIKIDGDRVYIDF